MAILNGQLADATEINKVILRPAMMALANDQKAQFTNLNTVVHDGMLSGFSDQDYLIDGMMDDLLQDVTNSTVPVDNEEPFITGIGSAFTFMSAFNCEILDSFNGAFDDANVWTIVGSVAFNGNDIQMDGTDAITTDGSNPFDMRTHANDTEFIFHWRCQGTFTSGSVFITNGTTSILLRSNTGVTVQETVKVKVDKSAEEAFVSVNGGAFGAAIDISSVTTNWYIRFSTQNSNTIHIYFVGFVDGSAGTVDYVTAAKTMRATKTAATLSWDYDLADSQIAGFISSDNGTTYVSATKDIWTTISVTGTQAKLKLTCTLPTTLDATSSTSDIGNIKFVGAYFDG